MGKDTRFVASVNLVEGNALAARTHGTAAEVAVNNDISIRVPVREGFLRGNGF
jgi:hypothetical protein